MIDHLVFFAVREDVPEEEVENLLASIRGLRDSIPAVMDLSVGENFSGRAGDYTHALFVRFEDREGLQEYLEHPEHLAVVEKLDSHTSGRLVADYEF